MLLLGHHGPVRGAALGARRVRTHPRRRAVRARRDRRGDERRRRRVDRDARRSRCPRTSTLGEAYGRVDWSVRGDLGDVRGLVPPALDARPLRRAARAGRGRDGRARRRCGRGRGTRASTASRRPIRSPRCASASSCSRRTPNTRARGAAYRAAHEQLLADHGGANFWLTRWLEGEVRSATEPARAARRRVSDPIRIDDLREPRLDDVAARGQGLRRNARHHVRRRRHDDAASERAGCDDFGAPDVRQRLDAMIAAVEADFGTRADRALRRAQSLRATADEPAARRGSRAPRAGAFSRSSCPHRSSSSGCRARARRTSST